MWTAEHRRAADRRGLRYPSDLTDAEWALIALMIPPAKHGGPTRPASCTPFGFLCNVPSALYLTQWGAERRVLRARVCEEMERLRGLRFDVERYPAWDPELRRWNPSSRGEDAADISAGAARDESAPPTLFRPAFLHSLGQERLYR